MASPKRRIETAFVMFDVLYVDGTRSSNRRVPAATLTGFEGDAPAKAIIDVIEAQDHEIGLASGRPRPDIKSVSRSSMKAVTKP